MNSLFNLINRAFNIKNSKVTKIATIIATKDIIQTPPKLSLESAGEWEKEYQYTPINDMFRLDSIIDKNSVPILSYT